jgi:MYXO-CTERM domain-containing protein
VGSSDGWLYAIDPCTASLAFTHEFTAPVGNVVFGDSDGDGHDELLVSVADGYLYALKQPPIAAPAEVIDTDPDHGIDTADVDDISTIDQLFGAWSPVPGATSYQVAVVHADLSGFVAPWQEVGLVTKFSATALGLTDGARYVFVVRALKNGAPSPDALSDGVTVHKTGPEAGPDAAVDAGSDAEADAAPDAAPDASNDAGSDAARPSSTGALAGGGCDCRSTPAPATPPAGPSVFGLALVAWAARRRRAVSG